MLHKQSSLAPLYCLTAVMTAGSSYYTGSWILGRVGSGQVLNEFFACSKDKVLYSTRELFLYKNYVLGLLLTPNLTLLAGFWRGTAEAIGMASLSAAVANGLYALHLTTTPDSKPSMFQPKIRLSAAISHSITAAICAYSAWVAFP